VLIKGLDGVLPDIRHEENTSPTRTPPEDATARSHFGKWVPEKKGIIPIVGMQSRDHCPARNFAEDFSYGM
jgi:hypothetical protein